MLLATCFSLLDSPLYATWCHLMPLDATWCHSMPLDAAWCHLMPLDAAWCHLLLPNCFLPLASCYLLVSSSIYVEVTFLLFLRVGCGAYVLGGSVAEPMCWVVGVDTEINAKLAQLSWSWGWAWQKYRLLTTWHCLKTCTNPRIRISLSKFDFE